MCNDCCSSGSGTSTGAVPRTWTVGVRGDDTRNTQTSSVVGRPPALLPHQQSGSRRDHSAERRVNDKNEGDEERSNAQNAGIVAESSSKDGAAKDADKNKAFSSRTLHTIKDMISSRFGGVKGMKEGGGECVGDGDKTGDGIQNSAASLNNNPSGGGDKGPVGSPRKTAGSSVQREDGQGDEVDLNHRQHLLGGGPQVIGPSRNYGDVHHGMGIGTSYQGRRGVVEGAECLDRVQLAEAEDALRRSGRGKGGPHDHGIYATARNMQQEHYSRSIGDFTRELANQGQEPMYGYHAGSRQHQMGAKVSGNSRMAQNFGSQSGLLDQNSIYMVMRQSGNMNQQQAYGQGTSHGAFSNKDAHYGHQETELRTDFDAQQQQSGGSNDNRRCVVDNRVIAGQDREAIRTVKDDNSGIGYCNNPVRDSGRRGSQTHLDDEDDDDGGFLVEANNSRKNLAEGNCASARENLTSQGASGNYSQHQSSGQSSDYEKATQRSTGQSSSNADSGRGSTIYSSGHKMVGAKRGEVCERLDTSTESSESPQALGRRETIYGLSSANNSEWVDIVESELRQILDPKMHGLGHQPPPPAGANSTLSESISSLTPPLPPLSPGGGSSPTMSPRSSGRYKLSARCVSLSPLICELVYNCNTIK
ncbi:hypothetical protein PR048_028848 [Dryococelus australis]|uniref:Uncharacterized protein n=1 Tax=Dryococelus australis TaxID=614101 RepID=A0ABQ9GBQ2_9NEOP|nr:hypothetical protein PR048_028848 [Dryococelus australis]